MIEISNLRISKGEEWTKVVADIKSDIKRLDNEDTMWVAVKNENASMLNDENYDAFLCLPVYMAMYYKTDLRIHGRVSNVLYHNVLKYVQPIIRDFKDGMKVIDIIVDGFVEVQKTGDMIGTGISCGVDCFQTIYDNFVLEEDKEYKINTLFNFNCGWHGKYGDDKTFQLFLNRSKRNKKAADDMNLPLILVDSNLHAFLQKLGDQSSYFNLYTCAFALEKGLSKYYISSSYSYLDTIKVGYNSRNKDWSEFGDPLAIPLLRSKRLELISDGCQYERTAKTERIVDWEISKKHLNVCCVDDNEENCSVCKKCARTMLTLEAMGKLEEYQNLFDLDAYKKVSYANKCLITLVGEDGRDGFRSDIYRYYKNKRVKLPTFVQATFYVRLAGIRKRLKSLSGKFFIGRKETCCN